MLLSLEHLAKTHRIGPYSRPAVVDVSLAVDAGDFIAVWGEHHAGKTTLLRLAAGLDLPDSGVVRHDGVELAQLSCAAIAALRLDRVAFVQAAGPQSLQFSVLEWVALPLLRANGQRRAHALAMAMLERVDVAACHAEKWGGLSDAEAALVSLAHGLVRRPRLLLVDDPTRGLDPLQQREVTGLLRAIADDERVGILMTASQLTAVARAHDAYTLTDGVLHHISDPAAARRRVVALRDGQPQPQ